MLIGVILDVDGTLVDSNDAHASAWVEAFAGFGIDVPFARVRRTICMGGDKLIPALTTLDADDPKAERIVERRREIFLSRHLPHVQPFPGAHALLERMRGEGLELAVASSAHPDELRHLLDIVGARELIASKTSSEDAPRSKPDPDIVRAALARRIAHRA